jgi:alkylhydroperoxidase/carboxymuconolactone decarboxylase family protein YurZ
VTRGDDLDAPGLDSRSRRLVVIATLVALGRVEELRMHVRAALQGQGLSLEEIKEVVLQRAVSCGVPAPNTAFEAISQVLHELTADS